jgi:pimeloyl-ACP methyl ester carboxylesterase
MRIGRRKFCGVSVAALGASTASEARQAAKKEDIGAARWPATFSEGDFYGMAADLQEIRELEGKIQPGHLQSYMDAWMGLAGRVEGAASTFEKEGRKTSAHECYLRASNYYNRAQMGLLRAGDGERIVGPYRKVRETWENAWRLVPPPFDWVQIPFEATTLPGFFVHASRAPAPPAGVAPCSRERAPVVLFFGGSDHLNERSYFRYEPWKFNSRGVSYFTLDGPGQGEPLNLRRIYLRPDYEKVASAALDYLATRPDVDMTRVGLYGQAFAGFFAARAAIAPRIRAVACRSAGMDLKTELYDFSDDFRPQFEYMLGVKGADAARRALDAYNLRSIAKDIRVPIAIYHGADDEVQDPQGARRLYDAIPHQQKVLRLVPGFGRNVGKHAELELIDWLVARLTS